LPTRGIERQVVKVDLLAVAVGHHLIDAARFRRSLARIAIRENFDVERFPARIDESRLYGGLRATRRGKHDDSGTNEKPEGVGHSLRACRHRPPRLSRRALADNSCAVRTFPLSGDAIG
jgi:hypothetical protein